MAHAGTCKGKCVTGRSCKNKTSNEFCHIHAPPQECSICLEVVKCSDRHYTLFGCKHKFHFSCIKKWAKSRADGGKKPNCPCCRTTLSSTDMDRLNVKMANAADIIISLRRDVVSFMAELIILFPDTFSEADLPAVIAALS